MIGKVRRSDEPTLSCATVVEKVGLELHLLEINLFLEDPRQHAPRPATLAL